MNTLVIATHGIIKKSSKLARKDIKKAEQVMKHYFKQENSDNEK